MPNAKFAIAGTLMDCDKSGALRYEKKAVLVIDVEGKILDRLERREFDSRHPTVEITDVGDNLILPGFIDGHLHFPQIDQIGRFGKHLLKWLEDYIYPAEAAYADQTFSDQAASRFVDTMLKNGTTTGAIFSSSHLQATESLLRTLKGRKILSIVGKTSMDRLAPESICSAYEQDAIDVKKLIETWHEVDDLYLALTPRFAPSCTPEMLQSLGDLKSTHPSLYIQTHHAETKDEVELVKKMFPGSKSYAAVYDQYGLLSSKTILGHSIYATDEERQLIASHKTIVAHCPTSNNFLGSGLFAFHQFAASGVPVIFATDVGAGTSFSMWKTMAAAYCVAQLQNQTIDAAQLLHRATGGAADALGLSDKIGRLDPGLRADLQIVDWKVDDLLRQRFEDETDPDQRLFSLIIHGDDRMVSEVYVQGSRVH